MYYIQKSPTLSHSNLSISKAKRQKNKRISLIEFSLYIALHFQLGIYIFNTQVVKTPFPLPLFIVNKLHYIVLIKIKGLYYGLYSFNIYMKGLIIL